MRIGLPRCWNLPDGHDDAPGAGTFRVWNGL